MKDIFGRELAIGDTIICSPGSPPRKDIQIETVAELKGSNRFSIRKGNGGFMTSECLILKRADGTIYFDNEGLPLNCWITNHTDNYIIYK